MSLAAGCGFACATGRCVAGFSLAVASLLAGAAAGTGATAGAVSALAGAAATGAVAVTTGRGAGDPPTDRPTAPPSTEAPITTMASVATEVWTRALASFTSLPVSPSSRWASDSIIGAVFSTGTDQLVRAGGNGAGSAMGGMGEITVRSSSSDAIDADAASGIGSGVEPGGSTTWSRISSSLGGGGVKVSASCIAALIGAALSTISAFSTLAGGEEASADAGATSSAKAW